MTRIRVNPYKMGSKSAKALADSLGALRTRSVGSYKTRRDDFVVNWGAGTTTPTFERIEAFNASGGNVVILNKPEFVANASNKLKTFQILREAGIPTPDFTQDRITASDWEDEKIFVRHTLNGHSGEGIEIVTDPMVMLPLAPLYVKAIENHGEYRVHVFRGQVIDYVKKRKRRGVENNSDIRNLASGWVYTRENLTRLERIEELAIRAVSALGLDFGAVDIIKDENRDVFVLEVNTACGMSGTTLSSYVNAITRLIENHA